MSNFDHKEINNVIHGRVKLTIMSLLAARDDVVDFTFLKKTINVSDGNLSSHISKLEAVAYIKITRQFKSKRPQALVALTKLGREEFISYITHLESMLPKTYQNMGLHVFFGRHFLHSLLHFFKCTHFDLPNAFTANVIFLA